MNFESVYGNVPFSSYLVLPAGVTTDMTTCKCDDLNCFYCSARNDAMWDAARDDEEAEWEEKYNWQEVC